MNTGHLPSGHDEMAELFDFGEAAMSEDQSGYMTATEDSNSNPLYPSHLNKSR